MMRMLCFGDSNTYGYDPRGFYGGRYDAGDRWTDRLAQLLGWEIVNAGANGRQIPCHFRELQEFATFDVVALMLGTNDLLQGTTAQETARRMEAFLIQLRPHCKRILLICPPPMKRGAWVGTDKPVKESVLLGDAYKALGEQHSIPVADARSWNIELAYDGVHITEKGHHSFAAQMKKICDGLDFAP